MTATTNQWGMFISYLTMNSFFEMTDAVVLEKNQTFANLRTRRRAFHNVTGAFIEKIVDNYLSFTTFRSIFINHKFNELTSDSKQFVKDHKKF